MDGVGWNNFSPYYLVHKILERIVAQKIGDIYIFPAPLHKTSSMVCMYIVVVLPYYRIKLVVSACSFTFKYWV